MPPPRSRCGPRAQRNDLGCDLPRSRRRLERRCRRAAALPGSSLPAPERGGDRRTHRGADLSCRRAGAGQRDGPSRAPGAGAAPHRAGPRRGDVRGHSDAKAPSGAPAAGGDAERHHHRGAGGARPLRVVRRPARAPAQRRRDLHRHHRERSAARAHRRRGLDRRTGPDERPHHDGGVAHHRRRPGALQQVGRGARLRRARRRRARATRSLPLPDARPLRPAPSATRRGAHRAAVERSDRSLPARRPSLRPPPDLPGRVLRLRLLGTRRAHHRARRPHPRFPGAGRRRRVGQHRPGAAARTRLPAGTLPLLRRL